MTSRFDSVPRFLPLLLLIATLASPALALPPVADAGPDQIVDCALPTGAEVTLDGSASSDPDMDPLSYSWTDAAMTVLSTDVMPTLTLLPGVHELTLTVDDGTGSTASDSVLVTVNEDVTPPVIGLSEDSDELWPPNHKRQRYDVAHLVDSVTDDCSTPSAIVVSFGRGTSDEADEGTGDGSFPEDIAFDDDCESAYLRAERAGPGDGRVYQLFVRAEDEAGNAAEAPFTVSVPHDRAHGAVDSGAAFEVASACGEGEASCPPAPDPGCVDAGAAAVTITAGKKGAKLRWSASEAPPGSRVEGSDRLCVYTDGEPAGGSSGPRKVKVKGNEKKGALSVAAKGAGHGMPALPLAPGAELRLELHDGAGQCVASSFDAPDVNEAGRYDARTD